SPSIAATVPRTARPRAPGAPQAGASAAAHATDAAGKAGIISRTHGTPTDQASSAPPHAAASGAHPGPLSRATQGSTRSSSGSSAAVSRTAAAGRVHGSVRLKSYPTQP